MARFERCGARRIGSIHGGRHHGRPAGLQTPSSLTLPRRDEHNKRIFDVEQYHPPLSTIHRWSAPQIVVKLSPGVKLEQLAGLCWTG